jgi:hypothetical protein
MDPQTPPRAAGRRVNQPRAAHDQAPLVAGESVGALTFDLHLETVGLAEVEVVEEREGQPEGVEPGPEIGRGGGDGDADAAQGRDAFPD